MADTPTYEIDYEDERIVQNNEEMQDALDENDLTYTGMIGSTDQYYNDLINKSQEWADKQAQIQQDNTDFTIEKIEQQKEQAQKDYIKEQSGAYVDWQKQSNQYGVEAERQASAGLDKSGYSESSQVAMYNTYQNRVATAREVLAQAKLNYDNGIKDAMLQNNAALAEIYATAYIKQAELALEGFQYKNQLILDQADKKLQIKENYWQRELALINQQNIENEMAEDIRQFNENQKWQTEQAELDRLHDEKLEGIRHEYDKKLAEIEQTYKLAYLDAQTEKEKELLDKQHENDLAKLEAQYEHNKKLAEQELANEKALLAYQKELAGQPIGTVGGSSSRSSGKGVMGLVGKVVGSAAEKVKTAAVNTAKNAPLNMQSVVSAFGPISEAQLAKYVAEGKATLYVKNGQTYVKKVTTVQRPGIKGVNLPK